MMKSSELPVNIGIYLSFDLKLDAIRGEIKKLESEEDELLSRIWCSLTLEER
jgi:hypothetical protein